MKTIIFLLLIALFVSCKKDGAESEPQSATATEVTSDTVTSQPVDNPEPGVEKSGSQEQVP